MTLLHVFFGDARNVAIATCALAAATALAMTKHKRAATMLRMVLVFLGYLLSGAAISASAPRIWADTLCNALSLGLLIGFLAYAGRTSQQGPKSPVPVSVNYHFTRVCNKECGFFFHTAKTPFRESEERAKRGLALLKRAGMKKLNFAGGEPFMYKDFVGHLVQYGKEVLQLESISIVTNGNLIREDWLQTYGKHLDILTVSCDSFDEATNIRIGRGSGDNVTQLFRLRDWCKTYGIKFKLNTVVCKFNVDEDMSDNVAQLDPFRWKCFQVLAVAGENDSDKTLRDVRKFQIADEEFDAFCDKHKHLDCFVPESNRVMASSYLILDEYMRFLGGNNKSITSKSILDVGVDEALRAVHWDEEAFAERGGVYDWSKEEWEPPSDGAGCGGEHMAAELEW